LRVCAALALMPRGRHDCDRRGLPQAFAPRHARPWAAPMRPGQRATDAVRARLSAAQSTPEAKARRRAQQAEYWTDARRQAAREAAIAHAARPEVKAKVRIKTSEAMSRPEVKERARAKMQTYWTPARRQAARVAALALMADPEHRARARAHLDAARGHPDRKANAAEGIRRRFEQEHTRVELAALRDAWRAARPAAQREFLTLLFGPLWGAARG
jgi:hypothetical protein